MFSVSVISNISTWMWLRMVFIRISQPEPASLTVVLVGDCYMLTTSVHADRLSGESDKDADAVLFAISKERKKLASMCPRVWGKSNRANLQRERVCPETKQACRQELSHGQTERTLLQGGT